MIIALYIILGILTTALIASLIIWFCCWIIHDKIFDNHQCPVGDTTLLKPYDLEPPEKRYIGYYVDQSVVNKAFGLRADIPHTGQPNNFFYKEVSEEQYQNWLRGDKSLATLPTNLNMT